MSLISRRSVALSEQLASAGVPVISLRVVTETGPVVEIQYDLSATPAQVTNGNALLSTFDWTSVADVADVLLRQRTTAKTRLADAAADLKLLRALASILLDEINTLRAAVVPSLPPRTMAQLRTAIQARIDTGAVDT